MLYIIFTLAHPHLIPPHTHAARLRRARAALRRLSENRLAYTFVMGAHDRGSVRREPAEGHVQLRRRLPEAPHSQTVGEHGKDKNRNERFAVEGIA